MDANEVKTLPQLLDYIEKHAARIFVRARDKTGKLVPRSLATLTGDQAIHHVFRFIREGVIPVRILTDEEVKARLPELQKKEKPSKSQTGSPTKAEPIVTKGGISL